MTLTVLIYIKPDAETGQPLRDAVTAACDKVLVDACGVGVTTCWEYFKRSQLRRYTSPSLGAVTVRLTCEYVGGRRVAEQSVRARSKLWNCRFS